MRRSTGGVTVDRYSVLLIALAAVLWASDALFRNQLIGHLSASQIVVAEDGLITLFLLPVVVRSFSELSRLDWRGWVAVVLIAGGAQALATLLFTQSFSYRIYAETFVLQQTQPLIALVLAWVVLGERRRPWFWALVLAALFGVYMVVFAYNPADPLSALQHGRFEAGLFALGAAVLWAAGTVLGRYALGSLSFWAVTSLRFTLALPVLVVVVLVQYGFGGFGHYTVSDFLPNLLAIALVPGLLALLLYYRALSRTPASLSTIAELALPVTATFIAAYQFHQTVYPAQIVGTALLIVVIILLNVTKDRAAEAPASAALKPAEV